MPNGAWPLSCRSRRRRAGSSCGEPHPATAEAGPNAQSPKSVLGNRIAQVCPSAHPGVAADGREPPSPDERARCFPRKTAHLPGTGHGCPWHPPRNARSAVTCRSPIVCSASASRWRPSSLLPGWFRSTAQDRLCDPGNEDCRAILINYIRNETVGIDVAFWFMEDARYTNELIRAVAGRRSGARADGSARQFELPAERRPASRELQSAGIPMRKRLTNYILHWKMMLFHGQNVVEFSGANLQRQRLAARHRDALRELHRRRHLLHQRHRDRQQLPHASSTTSG